MTCDYVSMIRGGSSEDLLLIQVRLAQERPCTRCIKRNIGHLCHDEPREPAKKTNSDPSGAMGESEIANKASERLDVDSQLQALDPSLDQLPQERVTSTASLVQPTPVHAPHPSALTGTHQGRMLHPFSLNPAHGR
jgi:hypothetical protein